MIESPLMPMLCAEDAEGALRYYAEAFGGEMGFVMKDADGRIGHGECIVEHEGARLTIAVASPYEGYNRVPGPEGAAVVLYLYVADVDAATARAEALGGVVLQAAEVKPHGHRVARVRDPFGYVWLLATVIRRKSDEEIAAAYGAD